MITSLRSNLVSRRSGVSPRRSTWDILGPVLLALAFAPLGAPARAAAPVIESFIAQATAENPRHPEADILVLRDGTLFAAWAEFYGGARDDAPARITSARSTDGGRTWGARTVIQENSGKANVMSVSLVRTRTGDVLFFYLQKNSLTDLKAYVRRSSDDTKTWSAP
ncbi:MAG: exo-alpha-sialidase, partial [Opitutaceae bacterium]|nr:exo-alpha-sialidase [Opitutaceae bacterium]